MTTKQSSKKIVTRRAFLQIAGMGGVGAVLAACAPAAAPAPTAAPVAEATAVPTQAPIATPEKVAPTEAPPPTEAPKPTEASEVVAEKVLVFGAEGRLLHQQVDGAAGDLLDVDAIVAAAAAVTP